MSKIAIATDSNSGITQSEGKEMGVSVIPMPFLIDDKEYYEDITLDQDGFYEMLKGNASVSTSQPSIESLTNTWNEILESSDEIIYIPMSSGLSGSCQTAKMLAEDYDGKVHVIDNQRISVTQKNAVQDALRLREAGKSAQEICKALMDTKLDASIYIMVDTLKYLRKGGRLTPAVAALGTILRIKPVLQIQGEKLKKDMEQRFGGNPEQVYFNIAHTQNEQGAIELKAALREMYPGIGVMINPLSLSVSCHIGPGALAVALAKKV